MWSATPGSRGQGWTIHDKRRLRALNCISSVFATCHLYCTHNHWAFEGLLSKQSIVESNNEESLVNLWFHCSDHQIVHHLSLHSMTLALFWFIHLYVSQRAGSFSVDFTMPSLVLSNEISAIQFLVFKWKSIHDFSHYTLYCCEFNLEGFTRKKGYPLRDFMGLNDSWKKLKQEI